MVQPQPIIGMILHGTNMKKNGFTLIELLIYLVIVGMVMGALIPFAWNMIGSSAKSSVQQEVAGNLAILSERLKSEIRNCNGINTGTSNFGVNLAANAGTQLSLSENSPNDPTLIDVSGGQIRIKQGTGAYTFLNPTDISVTNLTFVNYSSADLKTKHIGFTLTISSNYSGARQEFKNSASLQTSAEVRSN